MKRLFTIIMLLPLVGLSQEIAVHADTLSHSITTRWDTIPVVMLVSDSTGDTVLNARYEPVVIVFHSSGWKYGYEVVKPLWLVIQEQYYLDLREREPVAAYLDDKKRPLSKSIIVWQTKRR
jgi:hypothetical protein